MNEDLAVAGVDDHVYIFITNEKIKGDIKKYIVKKTGLNQTAFEIIIIDMIPKNESGKTVYSEFAKYYS